MLLLPARTVVPSTTINLVCIHASSSSAFIHLLFHSLMRDIKCTYCSHFLSTRIFMLTIRLTCFRSYYLSSYINFFPSLSFSFQSVKNNIVFSPTHLRPVPNIGSTIYPLKQPSIPPFMLIKSQKHKKYFSPHKFNFPSVYLHHIPLLPFCSVPLFPPI